MNESFQPIADDYHRIATQEYSARNNTLLNGLKNRIELIRDYTVFGTALLAAVISLAASSDKIASDKGLLLLSGFLSLVSVFSCFISRLYYIQEGDNQTINTETRFARDTSIAQAIKFAKDKDELEEMKKNIPSVQEKKTDKWFFFINDIKNIGILIGVSGITLMCALLLPSWNG
jgi:hypothetical protein